MKLKCSSCGQFKQVSDKANTWFNQEMEMARNRVLLHLKKQKIPYYSGNPMTAKQAICHLHSVKNWIRANY